jgi:hypothetical protein
MEHAAGDLEGEIGGDGHPVVADGDPVAAAATDGPTAAVPKRTRDRMSKLSEAEHKERCMALASKFGDMVDELEQRAPEGRDLRITFSLTYVFDAVEHSKVTKSSVQRVVPKHLASNHALVAQLKDPDVLDRMKIQVQQIHLDSAPERRKKKEASPVQQQCHKPVKVTTCDLATARDLLNKHSLHEWGLAPGGLAMHFMMPPCMHANNAPIPCMPCLLALPPRLCQANL